MLVRANRAAGTLIFMRDDTLKIQKMAQIKAKDPRHEWNFVLLQIHSYNKLKTEY
jgi:hypothetical protein